MTTTCECAGTHIQGDGVTPCPCVETDHNGWRPIATCDVTDDVLVYCEDTKQQFVAYQERGSKTRGLFCYAIHRGAYIMCRPQWWKPLEKGPLS